ncbi:MAG: signal recognition particle protein [Candidatus Latescibacterota bacterium]|nr:signal recognition particle protein [Candidatus Latescibacterota bacterium]
MFDRLSERFDDIFRQLRGQGRITERNIDECLREIRRSLLEADVNFKVARTFISRIREQALGEKVIRSLTASQQLVKIVHSELVILLGGQNAPIKVAEQPPTIVMMVGLQGSGKTTMVAKLGHQFKKQGRPVLLVAADTYRPAAADQLDTLGKSIDVPVFRGTEGVGPVEICDQGVEQGRATNRSVVILDTAGRLSIDEAMMTELSRIRDNVKPHEILFVADSMIGQDAVETAERFYEQLAFDGVLLSKMDSDARGGAALSICEVTGAPIKYIGTGEKVEDIEPFHPDRMASRILGMGDVLSLVERAEAAMERDKASKIEERLRKATFTFEDFLDQLQAVKKMGPLDHIIGMIPGAGKAMKGMQVDDGAFGQVEAIIRSMTKFERQRPQVLNGSRRKRIARGSGTTIQNVNKLVKQFQQMQKMMKQMSRTKKNSLEKRLSMPLVG